MIKGDSTEYNLLEKWTKDFDCQGFMTAEIGVREGLGSKIMMDNLKNVYLHVGIDPYGNLKYQHYDDTGSYTCDYTDTMRDKLLEDMAVYKGRFRLYNDTDTVFMNDHDFIESKYAFVHFDGPHMTKDVLTESIWFANRCAPTTRFVYDDFPRYNMQLIRDCLKPFGFDIMDQGKNKICLEKQRLVM